jgi:hypothetical protein
MVGVAAGEGDVLVLDEAMSRSLVRRTPQSDQVGRFVGSAMSRTS